MKLSILILSIDKRKDQLQSLLENLNNQIGDKPVEIIINSDDGSKSKGMKRNECLEKAKGEYLCFFDDDDIPGDNYINTLFEGIGKGVDVISLRGIITFNGSNPEIFEHSIKYSEYKTNQNVSRNHVKYERYPNHLNCIKSDIAKQFKFPEINFDEDTQWAAKVFESSLLKTEHYSDEIIYYYKFSSEK